MTAIEQAYASNTESPILTVQIVHPAITGGTIRLAQSSTDIQATDEGSNLVTFRASAIKVTRPDKSTDGDQVLSIQIDNVSNEVYREITSVINYNRSLEQQAACIFRTFLPSDLTAPSGPIYELVISGTAINALTATISATFSPMPDISFPRRRYYPTVFPGVKYV